MTVQVFVGRASFERTCQMSVPMDELGPVLSLVLGYWESSVVGPICDMDCQGFQHTLAEHYASFPTEGVSVMLTRVYNIDKRSE